MIATWLILLLFSLGNAGADFGLLGEQLLPTLERFLGHGIAQPSSRRRCRECSWAEADLSMTHLR